MADTRDKISYFLKQVQHWLPYIIQDETQKQQVKLQFENSLREILARGGEQRTTNQAQMINDLIKDLYAKEHFLGRPYSEQGMAQYLQKTNPDVFAATGYQMPADTGQVINTALDASKRVLMAEMAGETANEEDLRQVTASLGGDAAQKAVSEIIKVQEAAKGRPLEERRVAAQEVGLPLEERKVAVSESENKRRWKEFEGQISDMTAKEARKKLDKLEVERRRYKAKAVKTKDAWGDPIPEDEIKAAKSVIAEIEREEEEIRSRFAPGKPDKFGFKLGEIRTSPKGKVRYVGNNQWELVD